MKRLICIVLSIIILLPILGMAYSVDLKLLDDAALEELYEAVLAERLARMDFESFVVQKGTYRIGVDVPAGAFRVEHSGGPWSISNVIISKDGVRWLSKNQVFSDRPSEIGRLVLEPGYLLIIEQEAARFFTVTGGVTFEK